MLKIVRIFVFFLVTPLSAQINMFDAVEKDYVLDLDPESYPQLKFAWNFDGKVQGIVNTGLTELLDNKDYERAIKHFDEAALQLPTLVPAYYYRGICHKLLDNRSEAKDDLTKASALAPQNPEILLELAEIYEMEYDYTTAEKLYEQALEKDANFAPAYFNLANLNMRKALSFKATKYFKKCLEVDSTFIASHVRQGILAFSMDKRPTISIAHFNRALAIDSTFEAALFWRGMMFLRENKFSSCLDDWNKLVLYNPEDPVFKMLRAFLYLDLKDYDNAFLDLKNVFSKSYEDENSFRGVQSNADKRLNLQFAVAYMNRTIYGLEDNSGNYLKKGFCFMVMERNKEAISAFKKSFKLQPSALSLFLSALTYEHSEKHDSAFFFYNDALKYDNDIFDAHKKRAIYYSELKDWKRAYMDFEEMIRLEPRMTTTYRLRALVRIQFKDYYGAIVDLTRFVRLDSTDHEVYVYRAFAKEAVKDFKGANVDYRNALEVNPEHSTLYENVVHSDLQINDTTHALATIERSEKKFGFQLQLFSTRLRIFIQQKNFSDAREELKKTRANKFLMSTFKDAEHSTLFLLEALISLEERNREEAVRMLNKAITHNANNHEALYLRSKTFISQGEKMKAIRDLKLLAEIGYSDSKALLDGLR